MIGNISREKEMLRNFKGKSINQKHWNRNEGALMNSSED